MLTWPVVLCCPLCDRTRTAVEPQLGSSALEKRDQISRWKPGFSSSYAIDMIFEHKSRKVLYPYQMFINREDISSLAPSLQVYIGRHCFGPWLHISTQHDLLKGFQRVKDLVEWEVCAHKAVPQSSCFTFSVWLLCKKPFTRHIQSLWPHPIRKHRFCYILCISFSVVLNFSFFLKMSSFLFPSLTFSLSLQWLL